MVQFFIGCGVGAVFGFLFCAVLVLSDDDWDDK